MRRKGTYLRPLFAAAALGLSASSAAAGDIASMRPIGFSTDGDVFAFEEFGIQDGSGFPYSNIYFIDTERDAFLPGTPIRIRLDDENAGLSDARSQSATKAAPLVEQYDMTGHPGLLAAFNPITDLDSPANAVRYRQFASDPPVGEAFAMDLREVDLPPLSRCRDLTPTAKGFRLVMTEENGKTANDVLHLDTTIPETRGCATGYRLGGVMVLTPRGEPAVHVALVQVLRFGFEGRDGRWIAVPTRVPR